jgi:2-(1,2-epoxy-1,2-dihydrophenyl)acetyl-CoA isomerase
MFRDAADKPAMVRPLIQSVHATLERLAAAPQIVVASLQGAVAGAGVSLALNADLALAADDASLNLAYARIGTSPDCGASWALPRLVGVRRALAIALLSETIGAAEALQLGLVNRVVPAASLEAESAALAARLAAGPAIAQGHIKRLMRDSFDHGFAAQLAREAAAFLACSATDDFAAGVAAFFAKRKPEFRGR